MRKLLFPILMMMSMIVSACWFTEANFNGTYIAGVNNFIAHYIEADNIYEAEYYNGQNVAMPLTVWVKVSDREADQAGEAAGTQPVIRAILQYRVLPYGNWVTVTDYDEPDWDLNFEGAVPLFGMNNINISVPNGTEMLIRVYFSDGVYETGDLNANISMNVPNVATLNSGGRYDGGWCAPHVMRIRVAGKRPVR